MGGLVIEQVRPGVRFIPEAAAAFRRAEAQVLREFGRLIDVNSTFRSWADQMLMSVNWGKYVAGKGPYPGHSKAVHPSESFHVQGVALDSDDWRNARIVAILADNGFIRNRLHVAGENHHFEWLRGRDNHYGEPIATGTAAPKPDPLEDMVNVKVYLYTLNNNLLLVDHLNKTIRELGNKDNFERRQFDGGSIISIDDQTWTKTFKDFAYVTRPNLAPGVTS